jgi:hypothetical protein
LEIEMMDNSSESQSPPEGKVQEAAGQAQEKAQEAAGKAQENVRQQIDQRSTEAGERVAGTAEDLRSVGEELRKQGKDTPAKLADRAAEQTEKVGSYLKENDAERILHDVEDFGRQRPWAMLAGGIVVGVAAARFLKASSRGRYQARSSSSGSSRAPSSPVQPRSSGVAPQTLGSPVTPPEPVVPASAVPGP